MTTISKSLAALGVAKQSAYGTPATNPTFLMGVRGGSPIKADITQTPEERTSMDYRGTSEVNRESIVFGIEAELRAHSDAIALLLYGALGAISTSGASSPYTHTITPGMALPYLTFWGLLGGSHIYRLQDAQIDELEITWEEAKRAVVKLTAIGSGVSYPGSVTPTTDLQRAASLQAGGGLFQIATIGASPATAPVKGGGFSIKNNLSPVKLSTSVVPADVATGHQSFETKLTLVPADLNPFRELVTGVAGTGGTTPSEQPVYGSYNTKLVIDASNDLTVTAPKIAFATSLPEADPSGGPAELELVGEPVRPVSGAAFTAVVRNATASY